MFLASMTRPLSKCRTYRTFDVAASCEFVLFVDIADSLRTLLFRQIECEVAGL